MGMKQMRLRSRHYLSYLQRREMVFGKNRKLIWGPHIKLDHSILTPMFFGEEEVEKGDKRGKRNRTEGRLHLISST